MANARTGGVALRNEAAFGNTMSKHRGPDAADMAFEDYADHLRMTLGHDGSNVRKAYHPGSNIQFDWELTTPADLEDLHKEGFKRQVKKAVEKVPKKSPHEMRMTHMKNFTADEETLDSQDQLKNNLKLRIV